MTIERRAWIIARLMALLLVVVTLQVAYWQLWRGLQLEPVALDPVEAAQQYARLRGEPTPEPGGPGLSEAASLAQLPQPVIQRTVAMLSTIKRGTIYDSEGNILAEDRGVPGDWTRFYADPSLAHTVGYTSALRTGIAGLEATYNEDLLGLNRPDTEIDRMLHRTIYGSDMTLTIDPQIQAAAAQSLGGLPGAIIVLEGKTGAVLAIASAPTFDPNQVNNPVYSAGLGWGTLIHRVTQGMYTPGSTFKTVTLMAALDTGQINERTIFDFGEPRTAPDGRQYYVYETDGGVIPDPNHKESRLDLTMSYVYSANAAFAKVADAMDPNTLIDYARRVGFNDPEFTRRFPLELPVSVPQLANDLDNLRSNNLLQAATGMGQGEILATPMNMALLTMAVVNDGSVPVPYMVEQIRDPEGTVVSERPNRHITRGIMSAKTARTVREMMIQMVTQGIREGQALVPGAVSGGKTGTAQLGGDLDPHSWFIGFAERDGQTVVIVILTEQGGRVRPAVPIFGQVASIALQEMVR